MATTATLSGVWKRQKLFMALFLAALGAWFLYDGLIGYPKNNERYREYLPFKEGARVHDWPAHAAERGWSKKHPEKLYTEGDIAGQFWMSGLTFVAALGFLGWMFASFGRTLRSDDEAIYGEKGERVLFSEVTGLGKKHWDSKGIAKVKYRRDGKDALLTIDDFKYEGAIAIVKQVEEHLAAETESSSPPADPSSPA